MKTSTRKKILVISLFVGILATPLASVSPALALPPSPVLFVEEVELLSTNTAAVNLGLLEDAVDEVDTEGGGEVYVTGSGVMEIASPGLDLADNLVFTTEPGVIYLADSTEDWSVDIGGGESLLRAIINILSLSNVKVNGGTFDGDKANYPDENHTGINVLDSQDVRISDVMVQNMPSDTGQNGGDGIYLGGRYEAGNTNVYVTRSLIDNFTRYGIIMTSGKNYFILENIVRNGTGIHAGIGLEPSLGTWSISDVIISKNYIEDNYSGILVYDEAEYIVINGNAIRGNGFYALAIYAPNITISENTIQWDVAGKSAIYVNGEDAEGLSIVNNLILGDVETGNAGIMIYDESRGITVTGNIIRDAHLAGIYLWQPVGGTLSYIFVSGNTIINSAHVWGVHAIHQRTDGDGEQIEITIQDNHLIECDTWE